MSVNVTSANKWYNDPTSFIFQLDNLAKFPVKDPSATNHVMGWNNGYLIGFGEIQINGVWYWDILIPSGGVTNRTTLGASYASPVTPSGATLSLNSNEANSYLSGSPNSEFKLADMETWQLSPLSNGQLY